MATDTTITLPRDAPDLIQQELIRIAPRGWLSWHLFATAPNITPPTIQKRKRKPRKRKPSQAMKAARPYRSDSPISLLMQLFGNQPRKPGEPAPPKRFWESGQQLRFRLPGEGSAQIVDRDDPRQFAILSALLADLTKQIPNWTHVSVYWLIYPAYFAEDLARETEQLRFTEAELFRAMVRERIQADPAWIPDLAKLAPSFPGLAPPDAPDRHAQMRRLIAAERKAQKVPTPKQASAAERIRQLADAGLERKDIARTLAEEGFDVALQHIARTLADWRKQQRPEEAAPTPAPAHRAYPVPLAPAREIPENARPETRARELLREGRSYLETQRRLKEEGYPEKIYPTGPAALSPSSLRRLAAEMRRADEARQQAPRPEQARPKVRSRSDVARELIRAGLEYGQVEEQMQKSGLKPLSRGQLRALKAGLKQ